MKKKPYIIGIICIVLLLITAIILYERFTIPILNRDKISVAKEYEKHYVLISKDMTTSFWQSVYESAKKEAEADDIYLEQIGSNLSEKYSMEDYLRISIASQVDGIIICPDGSDNVTQLIDEATDKGIPVITVLNDDLNTKRVSFVGINSLDLGLIYAEQIWDQITEETKNIYILFHSSEPSPKEDSSKTDSANNIFYQIKNALNEKLGDKSINIERYNIANDNEFDSEEAIRDIFISSKITPDILVCMEEVDTECACQAIVDYNKVGKVTIIGSYSSDLILEAVRKNLAVTTVAMDTQQLGRKSVQALLEYQEMGYVNNYFFVDLHIIDKENVILFEE